MCVDKTLNELGSFADLAKESESMELDWQLVLVACLSGRNGIMPTSEEATPSLEMMIKTVEQGGSIQFSSL